MCAPSLGQRRAVPWTWDQCLEGIVTRLSELPGLTYRTFLAYKERLDGGFVSSLAYAGLLVLSVEMSTSGVNGARGSISELSNQNSQRRGPAFQ